MARRRYGPLTEVQAETLAALSRSPGRKTAAGRLGLARPTFHARALRLMEMGMVASDWDEFQATPAGRAALEQAKAAGWRPRRPARAAAPGPEGPRALVRPERPRRDQA